MPQLQAAAASGKPPVGEDTARPPARLLAPLPRSPPPVLPPVVLSSGRHPSFSQSPSSVELPAAAPRHRGSGSACSFSGDNVSMTKEDNDDGKTEKREHGGGGSGGGR